MKCKVCGRRADVHLKYARLWLCKNHFLEYLTSRVEKSMNKYGMVKDNERLLVGVSGGKDSISLLDILVRLKDKFKYKILAVHINLGIGEYSEQSKSIVERVFRMLNVDYLIVNIRESLGYTIPQLASTVKRSSCSICGTVKRYILNLIAVKANMTRVVTGHNIDDLTTYILKSFLIQDYSAMLKLKPKTPTIDGLISRIRPLAEISENELELYAKYRELPYISTACPLRNEASLEFKIKSFLKDLDNYHPTLKIGFYRKFVKSIEHIDIGMFNVRELKLVRCKICGMPSNSEVCSFCRLIYRASKSYEPVNNLHSQIIKSIRGLNWRETK